MIANDSKSDSASEYIDAMYSLPNQTSTTSPNNKISRIPFVKQNIRIITRIANTIAVTLVVTLISAHGLSFPTKEVNVIVQEQSCGEPKSSPYQTTMNWTSERSLEIVTALETTCSGGIGSAVALLRGHELVLVPKVRTRQLSSPGTSEQIGCKCTRPVVFKIDPINRANYHVKITPLNLST